MILLPVSNLICIMTSEITYNILPVNNLLQLPMHLYLPGGKSVFPSVSFYACNRRGKEKIVKDVWEKRIILSLTYTFHSVKFFFKF